MTGVILFVVGILILSAVLFLNLKVSSKKISTPKLSLKWKWSWLLIFLCVLFVADILFMGRSVTHFVGGKFFPDDVIKLEKNFTPNGEMAMGSIEPGKYRLEVVGSYDKKWDSGRLSPINGSTGMNHPTIDKNILPAPTRSYGVVFAKVGGSQFFPGDSFKISETRTVFVEGNIPRTNINGNYENEGSVVVKIIKEE